jgi:alpha,alpha-trehalose phosphorylase
VRLFVDDEPFELATARIRRFERVLDMRAGVLRREVEFETARGRRILLRSRRLVSLDDRHLLAIDYEVVALDAPAAITLSSEIVTHGPAETADDPRRGKGFAENVLAPLATHALGARAVLHLATRNSGQEVACGIDHRVETPGEVVLETTAAGDGAQVAVLADLAAGESLRLSKYAAYHWAPQDPAGELPARVHRTLDRAADTGYEAIEFRHRRHVEDFWRRSDVEIDGAPEIQRAVRFNLFQLLQATARGEGLGVARARAVRSATRARCSRGARSPARRRRRGTRPAPRSTTSTPTSRTRCTTTTA